MFVKRRKGAVLALVMVLCLLLGSCGNSYMADDTGSQTDTGTAAAATTAAATTAAAGTAAAGTAAAGTAADTTEDTEVSYTMDTIPEFSGEPWVVIDDNQPDFDDDLKATTESFEYYGDLDYLARCTACEANIGTDLMPTEDRGSISSVHPSGWIQAKYDCVSGKDLYNRCHLIGYQLTGENANQNNLITGTRYLNVDGMLPFEDLVADYVKETGNHVLYKVTPIFEGDELVARGVHMEGWSMEDSGEGVCFNVYCYNVQPGVEIDYASGASQEAAADSIYAIHEGPELEAESVNADGADIQPALTDTDTETDDSNDTDDHTETDDHNDAADLTGAEENQDDHEDGQVTGTDAAETEECRDYVLNTKTKKFHDPSCSSVSKLSAENRQDVNCTRQSLIDEGYSPCGTCKP